jgi:arsenite oxidase small subunit
MEETEAIIQSSEEISKNRMGLKFKDNSLNERPCMTRRAFLLRGGLGMSVTLVTLQGFPVNIFGSQQKGMVIKASWERRKIGRLSELKTGEPLTFTYPTETVSNILVKLGSPAGKGVGPSQDVVAFNQQCTHMGGSLHGSYKKNFQVLGPCPLHLTTFDLTRHGMVVSGHATESLPQIDLESDGDDIYAIGVMGLVYGFSDMRQTGETS